jgi:hypothetical protein
MGNLASTEEDKPLSFGGYKNKSNPRPGYYSTPTDVFYRGVGVTNCDPNTFVKFGGGWAKDKDSVFYQGSRVPVADAKSFKVISKFGQDKYNKYHRGKIV